MNFLKKKTWSPYVSGILVGLLQIPSFLLVSTSLGTSRVFTWLSCTGDYSVIPEKTVWQIGVGFGIIIGAYFSSKLSQTSRPVIAHFWSKSFITNSYKKRFLMAFIGGMVFTLGAQLATGCTSGNGVSGIALLQVGSFIVIASMFAGGAIVALFLPKV